MATRYVSAAVLTLLLAACASSPPRERVVVQEVKVPVPTRAEPPAELLAPLAVHPLPVFVSLSDPAASSALTKDGERALKLLVEELLGRIEAWTAWATGDTPKP